MRKQCILTIGLTLLLIVPGANAQERKAFHKYCLVASITGGPSKALYTTRASNGEKINSAVLDGQIDPLITEFGITDRIGIGITRGGDNFNVDANKFYKQNLPEDAYDHMMSTSTHYLTLDASYHYFITKRLDLSVFGSIGYFNVSGSAGYGSTTMNYEEPMFTYRANGGVIRSGARARWYFTKRFGVMSMLYAYKSYVREPNRPEPISDAKGSGGISTTLIGGGYEIGLCFRIGKQKDIQTEQSKNKRKCRKRNIEENNDDKEPLITFVWD